jgi:Rab5 GDP/GTP exchange factor
MTTPAPPTDALGALTLTSHDEEDSNPWASNTTSEPEPALLNATLSTTSVTPVFTPATPPVTVDSSVLAAFDPLVDKEQQEASDAWATAEAHPPKPDPEPTKEENVPANETSPPPTPDRAAQKPLPPDPDSPTKATPVPSSASAFTTTFANLARTFSRPRSAAGQNADIVGGAGPSRLSGEVIRPVTPITANARSDSRARSNEAVFDFQRFLDQLRNRNAEPIAAYLRRYVNWRTID